MQKILFSFLVLVPLFAQAEDQVDLQWSICEPLPATVASRLEADNESKSGSITYYDSNPLKYVDLGVTFRVKEDSSDYNQTSSVKVRSANHVGMAGAVCEWDRYGDKMTYTCEVTGDRVSDTQPWTPDQERFLEAHGHVNWAELQRFGPYPTHGWKIKWKGYKLHLDTVNITDAYTPITELSVKVPYSEKDEDYSQVSEHLRKRGVNLCATQESKTLRIFKALHLR